MDNDDYQYLTQQFDGFGSAFSNNSKKEIECKCSHNHYFYSFLIKCLSTSILIAEIKVKTEQIESYLMKKTGERQPLPSLFVKGQPLGGMENIAKMVESMDFQNMLDTEGIEHNLAQIQSKDYLKKIVTSYNTLE